MRVPQTLSRLCVILNAMSTMSLAAGASEQPQTFRIARPPEQGSGQIAASLRATVETTQPDTATAQPKLEDQANSGFSIGATDPYCSVSWLATTVDRRYLGGENRVSFSSLSDSPQIHFEGINHPDIMAFLADASTVIGQIWVEVASSPNPAQTTVTAGKNFVFPPRSMPPSAPLYFKRRLWSENDQFPGVSQPGTYPIKNIFFRGQADFVITLRRDGTVEVRQIPGIAFPPYKTVPPVIPAVYAECMIRSLQLVGTHPTLNWPANYPKSEILCRVHCVAPQVGTLTPTSPQ